MVDNMKSQSKQLGKMYFTVAAILFGAQILFGLIAGTQFVYSGFLFELLDFNVARMVHINALVVWLLYAMIGSVYYLLPDETKIETVGIGLGKLWILCTNFSCYSCSIGIYFSSSRTCK